MKRIIKKLYYKNTKKLLAEFSFLGGTRDGFSVWYDMETGKKLAVELWVNGEQKKRWDMIKEK